MKKMSQMNKKITFISTLLLVTIGCDVGDGGHSILGPPHDDTIDEPEVRHDVYYFDEQPNLSLDDNGYYHLDINMTNWQTLHRLTGFISDSATSADVVNCRVEWESSHYWYLEDTLGYIVRRGLTDDLIYVNVDTSYVVGFDGMEVPTINPASYSNSDGEVNTMIAPVQSMVGDTMTVWYSWGGWYSEWKTDSLKIVLN